MKLNKIICLFLLTIASSCAHHRNNNSYLFGPEEAETNEGVRDVILSQMPKADVGYKWILFKGVMMQKPLSWNEYKKGNTYSTSVESVAKNGSFETGATIQVIRNIKNIYKITATEFAVRFLKAYSSQKDNTELKQIFGVGPQNTETIIYRYRNAPAGLKPIIVHKYIVISESKNYVAVITFESSEKTWEKYWEKEGVTMLRKINVIPY